MLLIAAAAIASALPQEPVNQVVRPVVQARATIRIVSGARVQWDQKASGTELQPVKTTVVQTTEGPRPARLVEFE